MAAAVMPTRPASRATVHLMCLDFLSEGEPSAPDIETSSYQVPFEERAWDNIIPPASADEVLDADAVHCCAACKSRDVNRGNRVHIALCEPFPGPERYWVALRHCPDCTGPSKFSLDFLTHDAVRRLERIPDNVVRLDQYPRPTARAA